MKWTYNEFYRRMTARNILAAPLPPLTMDDVEIFRQAEGIFREFGAEGVRRYFDALEAKAQGTDAAQEKK